MLAIQENGRWLKTTLQELRGKFPRTSFARGIALSGQSWSYDGLQVIVRVFTPTGEPSGKLSEIVDIDGVLTASWVQPPFVQIYEELTAVQFHIMIEEIGKAAEIRQAISSAYAGPARRRVLNRLERGQIFRRDDPLVVGLSAAVGLTAEDVDLLWLQATGY